MAMILTNDHKEEETRNTVIKPSISIDDLPDELFVEILQRVPCKSAFRCKSVSKRWFALISDPCFTNSFLRYHTNEKLRPREFVVNFYKSNEFLLTSQLPEVRFPLSLSFLPCSQFVGSSNGLLLCWDCESTFYVCNPLTKHWVVLPPASRFQDHWISMGFISYPSDDKSQCSFKVVRFTQFLQSKCVFKGETFSSETGQWKDFVLSCPQGFFYEYDIKMSRLAIACNGMLHWLLDFDKKILVYDPANDNEVHAIVDCPKDFVLPLEFFDMDCIGHCRGRIRRAELLGHQFPEHYSLKVWELEGYTTGKWSLIHRINLKELTWKENSPLPKAKSTIPFGLLAFHPYEDIMYLEFEYGVVSCNLQTKTLKLVCEFPDKGRWFTWEDCSTIVLPPWPTPVPTLPHDALVL